MKIFLEKYYKIIVSILVIIGLGLTIKLWLIGLEVTWGGGGFINLGLDPNFKYYWISAGYIAVILMIISIFLIFNLRKIDNKMKKLQISFWILFLGLIGKQVFFLVSPDFKFYMTPVISQYKDKEGNIANIDKYLKLVTKYCESRNSDLTFHKSIENLCRGKLQVNFKTVEEYIKVLEYAKNTNSYYLYEMTYDWIDENVGLENVIEDYNDDTFYAYIIKNGVNKKNRQLIYDITNNFNIKKLINNYNFSIKENMKLININKEHNPEEYWKKYDKQIDEKLKQIPEINQKILFY